MSKKALLVGINNFPRPDWALRGCINDTLAMQGLLTSYFDFQDGEIRMLHDRDATCQGVRDGLAWLLGDYDGDGSDVRIFHFSSHGTQVDDQSGDEWECMDEVIVPYDHDWGNPFRDDDLKIIFDPIPENVHFAFIADCCHSGTIQRALLEKNLIWSPRYLTPPAEVTERIEELRAKRDVEADAWVAEELPKMLLKIPTEQWASKIKEYIKLLLNRFRENRYGTVVADRNVLLAACQDRQTAADAQIEGEFRGAFTWGLSQAIREANGNLTYGQLIKRAATHMRGYEQKPQLECPKTMRNLKVFAPLA